MRYKQIIRESKKKSLPGAPSGVQIMTPQQFVANQSEESDVTEAKPSGESTLWRVEQSGATGRYHIVKGYQKRKVWKNSFGSGDFISKDAAQKKADELNATVTEGIFDRFKKKPEEPKNSSWEKGWELCNKDPSADPVFLYRKHGAGLDRSQFIQGFIANAKSRGMRIHGDIGDGSRVDPDLIRYKEIMRDKGVVEGDVVQFPKKHPYELLTNCPKCSGPLQGGQDEKGRLKLCMPCMTIYRAPNQQGVTEGSSPIGNKRPNLATMAEGSSENYKFHMYARLGNGNIKEFNVIANSDRNAKILAKKKLIEKGYTKISSIDIQGMSPVRGPVNYKINRGDALEEQGVAEGFFDIVQGLKNTLDNRQKLIAAAKLKRLSADFEQRKKQRKQRELAAASTHKWDPDAYDTTAKRGAINSVAEATKLAAPSRPIGDKELTDYLDRIRGVPDIDKKTGLPKVDKKGKEKYISGKTKQDKFRMPYIHRNSVMRYYSPDGKVYNTDLMKDEMKQRPPKLLKQNEKMKHSNGELEQFFNIGFAALVGAAIDESTNEVIIVNTCPGAGACMVDCFEMKGGFIQYEAGWLSRSKILTYLLNDPDGFSNQLNAEIAKEARAGAKGGYSVSVRWHNSGDFFSPEYIQLAFNIAKANPTVKFYAYTKIADAALADKPKNFIINWSEGAKIGQEKKIKAQDPNLERTKNSRIVPENLFWDLLKKDDKGNLDKEGADDKGAGGRWVMRDQAATMELKKRLAQKYGLSVSSILDYDEYMTKRNSIPTGMKYNVIVAPGEGDVSANDHGVLSTLLLRH